MRLRLPLGRLPTAIVLIGCVAPLLCSGCGSSEGSGNGASAAKDPKSKGDAKPRKSDSKPESSGSGGPKSVDGIPYDVFFDKPLVVAANTQTVAAAGTNTSVAANDAGKPTPAPEATTTKEPPKSDGGGAAAIKDIIDKEALITEVKNIRNYLAGKASSVSTYNSSLLEIAPEAATLAVLAVAATKHPDDFTWKKNAKHVRDLAWKIGDITLSKDGKTKNSFDEVADSFAKIDDILKGSDPAGLPDAEADKSFGDAVGGNLVTIMKRIKKSEEVLKATISSEAGLKKDADKAAQEGVVLAFLGAILTAPGFGWDGDTEFAGFAKPLVEGGKQITEAAKSGNFALYGEGITKVSKSCNDCHPKFKP
jgi:hypothetical protein